jgi:hypothetical protein
MMMGMKGRRLKVGVQILTNGRVFLETDFLLIIMNTYPAVCLSINLPSFVYAFIRLFQLFQQLFQLMTQVFAATEHHIFTVNVFGTGWSTGFLGLVIAH